MANKNRPNRRTPEARRVSKEQMFVEYLNKIDLAKAYKLHESLKPYYPDYPPPPPKWFQDAFAKVRELYLRAPALRKGRKSQFKSTTLDMVDWRISIDHDALKSEIARAFEQYLLPDPEMLEAAKSDFGEDTISLFVNGYARNLNKCMKDARDLFITLLAAKISNLTIETAREVALITLRDLGDELLPTRPFDFNVEVETYEQLLSAMLRDRLRVPLAGRPPKTDTQRELEAQEKEKELQAMSAAIDQITEEWPKKSNALMTVEILRRELAKKGRTMSSRTLSERLKDMGRSITSIRAEIEKNHAT